LPAQFAPLEQDQGIASWIVQKAVCGRSSGVRCVTHDHHAPPARHGDGMGFIGQQRRIGHDAGLRHVGHPKGVAQIVDHGFGQPIDALAHQTLIGPVY